MKVAAFLPYRSSSLGESCVYLATFALSAQSLSWDTRKRGRVVGISSLESRVTLCGKPRSWALMLDSPPHVPGGLVSSRLVSWSRTQDSNSFDAVLYDTLFLHNQAGGQLRITNPPENVANVALISFSRSHLDGVSLTGFLESSSWFILKLQHIDRTSRTNKKAKKKRERIYPNPPNRENCDPRSPHPQRLTESSACSRQKTQAPRKKETDTNNQYPILLHPPSSASPPTNLPIFPSSTSSNTLELRISHILVAVFPI